MSVGPWKVIEFLRSKVVGTMDIVVEFRCFVYVITHLPSLKLFVLIMKWITCLLVYAYKLYNDSQICLWHALINLLLSRIKFMVPYPCQPLILKISYHCIDFICPLLPQWLASMDPYPPVTINIISHRICKINLVRGYHFYSTNKKCCML